MNTRMPMPPSQWVVLRQIKSPRLISEGSARMEAPVVVKPLTTSNSASM